MSTVLTKISKDKHVHNIDMKREHDHLICVDNDERELYLVDKKDFYAATALRKNWQFVSFDGMIITPVIEQVKFRIEQTEETYYVEEEYEDYDPDSYTAKADGELPSWFADLWESGGLGSIFSFSEGDNGAYAVEFNSTGITFARNYRDKVAMSWAEDEGLTCGISVPGVHCTDEWSGEILDHAGGSYTFKNPPEFLGLVKVSACKKTSWNPPVCGNKTFGLTATFEKVTKTRQVPKVRSVDNEIPYTEIIVPDIIDNGISEWSFKVSELVSTDEILTEFLAYTESAGDASGIFLVGYDTDPNIMISVNRKLGKKLPLPKQKYHSDSRRSYMTKIPVPAGTQIVNIKYVKFRPPEEKTYGYIIGYSKCKNVKRIVNGIKEVKPTIKNLNYRAKAKNKLTRITNTSTEILVTDASGSAVSLKIQAVASFNLDYDAARFGDIVVKGSVYTDRSDQGKWIEFEKPLRRLMVGEFHIEKYDYTDVTGNRRHTWILTIAQYGYGPSTIYAGIKNVRIQYK